MTVATKQLALVLWLRSQMPKAAVATALRSIRCLEAQQLADSLDNANSNQVAGLLDTAFSLLLDPRRIAGLRAMQIERDKLARRDARRLARAKRRAEQCLSAALSCGYSLSLGTAGLALNVNATVEVPEDGPTAPWRNQHRVERLAAGRGLNAVERNIRSIAVALELNWGTTDELDGLCNRLWRQLHGLYIGTGAGCGEPTAAAVTGPDMLVELGRHQPAERLVSRAVQLQLPDPEFGVGYGLVKRIKLGSKRSYMRPDYRIEQLQPHGLETPAVLSGPAMMPRLWAWTERYPELYPGDAACYCVGRPGTPAHPMLRAPIAAPYRITAATAPAARLPNWEHLLDELNRLHGTAPDLLSYMAELERDELRRWVGRGRNDGAFRNAVWAAHHFLRRELARQPRWGNMYGRKMLASCPLPGFQTIKTAGHWCTRKRCSDAARYTRITGNKPTYYCEQHARQLATKLGT